MFKIDHKKFRPLKTYQYLTQKNIKSYKILNADQIYNSIEMGNQHMETSQTIAWKCGHFCICISANFDLYRAHEIYYRAINHSPMLGHQLDSTRRNHHSHKCAIIEKDRNIEVGIDRMGGYMCHEL